MNAELRIWDIPGGIHPPEQKALSNRTPIIAAPLPARLIVPLALKAERARAERGEQDAHHDREHRDICELLRDRCHRIYSSLFAKNWKYPHSKLCLPRRKDTFPPQPQSLAFLSSTFFS